MEIKGTVEEMIYQNEINSYTICTFQTEDELTTAVRIFTIYNNWRYFNINWKVCRTSRIWKTV